MNSIRFLYAALIATALIHGAYLTNLFMRYRRLRQQLEDMKRGGK